MHRSGPGVMAAGAAIVLTILAVVAATVATRPAVGTSPHHVIYYYQTLTDLSPVLNRVDPSTHRPFVTDVNLASFHLGHQTDGTLIHLNDHPPDDPVFAMPWRQLGQLQAAGVKVHMMLGGAAAGSYSSLFGDFGTFYPVLNQTIQSHHLDGIDLDVEESVSLSQIEMLINQLASDFGSQFLITLAPVASDLVAGGGGLSGFNYKQLFQSSAGSKIAWFNTQYYSGFGSLSSTGDYDSAVRNGFPPDRVVAGMLGNPNDGGGFVPINQAAQTVKKLAASYPGFAGVFAWEYFDALPGGTAHPEQWSVVMSQAMGGGVGPTPSPSPTPTPGGGGGGGVDLSPFYNNTGISDDSSPSSGGFDTGGCSYSEQALTAASLPPGAGIGTGGFSFKWPSAAAGSSDNVVAKGQRIRVGSSAGGRLGFLTAASNGDATGTATLSYTDGTTQRVRLRAGDWAGSGAPGNHLVASTPYRNCGGRDHTTVHVFLVTVRLRAGKTLSAVTLPGTVAGGALHVFAISSR